MDPVLRRNLTISPREARYDHCIQDEFSEEEGSDIDDVDDTHDPASEHQQGDEKSEAFVEIG